MFKNILQRLNQVKENYRIKYRYTGIYKNREVVKLQIMNAMGAVKLGVLSFNFGATVLEIDKAKKIIQEVSAKGGDYGKLLTTGPVFESFSKLNKNLSSQIHENYFLKQHYFSVVDSTIDEVQKAVKNSAEKEEKEFSDFSKKLENYSFDSVVNQYTY
ncbi:MAG TPA: hypothetical protein PKJ33_03905 [Alphaproteobacteria bacterium]|nr:hypothetical protein [Alphaproteobacteria bacterium]